MGDDASRYISLWVAAVEVFNDRGDWAALIDLLDDDVEWVGVGSSKAAAAQALEAAKARGWLRHDTLSIATAGPLLVATAQNTGADGSTWIAAGILAFNKANKITRIASLDTNAL